MNSDTLGSIRYSHSATLQNVDSFLIVLFIMGNFGCFCTHEVIICSEPKLQFHSLKFSLASYCQSTMFLTFRSIWGSQKWSQMIPHAPKHWVWHQNQFYSMFRSKVTLAITLPEVVIGLLQALQHVQIDLRLLKMVPNNTLYPKIWDLTPNSSL